MDKSRSCGNPQYNKGNCRRPRHTAVGFSGAVQFSSTKQSSEIIAADQNHAAEIIEEINDKDDADAEGNEHEFADPLLLNDKFGDPRSSGSRRNTRGTRTRTVTGSSQL
jgi:hypothetical protein